MIFRTQNKKTIITSMLMLFIFIASFGFLIAKSANFTASNPKEDVLGEVVSAPVVSNNETQAVNEEIDKKDEVEENINIEVEKNTQNIGSNHVETNNSTNVVDNGPEEQTCKKTLKAHVIPLHQNWEAFPFYFSGLMMGSFEETCLDTSNMRFEWYTRGSGFPSNLPRQLFSTSLTPIFSDSLEEGYYWIDFKVIADGLTSEVKDLWTMYTKPYIHVNQPPAIQIIQPTDGMYLHRVNYSTHVNLSIQLNAWARDYEDGGILPESSILWFLESESFAKQQIATGSSQYVTLTLPAEVCDDPEFKFTVIGTDSEGLSTEVTKIIKVPDTVCHHTN